MLVQQKLKDLRFFVGNPIINLAQGRLIFADDCSKGITSMLALVSVPSAMDIRELFDYFSQSLQHLVRARVLKTEFTRHYTIVLQFSSTLKCETFFDEYNGRMFNLIEEDPIVLKKVSKVASEHLLEHIGHQGDNSQNTLVLEEGPETIFSLTERMKTYQQEQTGLRLTERESLSFKDCPICLETFSETEPTIIILCAHMFHLKCLKDWTDQTCPVCRYQQFPFELTFCEKCDFHSDLWACIICGFIGCGGKLPVAGHISEHAVETSHIFSKPILKEISGRPKGIWDHSKNDYIHSIVHSQGNMITVEEEPKDKSDKGKSGKKASDIEEAINSLISSQLDNQRRFYEVEVRAMEASHTQCLKDNQATSLYIQQEITQLEEEEAALTKHIEDAKLAEAETHSALKELMDNLAALRKSNSKLRKIKKVATEGLEDKREEKRKELQALKAQITGIIVEMKDLKVHLENKKKMESMPMQQGSSIFILDTKKKGSGR